MVVKHTDSVRKSLATGLSVVISSSLSTFIEGEVISLQFVFGSFLAIAALHFFNNPFLFSCRPGNTIVFLVIFSSIFVCQVSYHNLSRTFPSVFRRGLPRDWHKQIHIHALKPSDIESQCRKCWALDELIHSVSKAGVSTTSSVGLCPNTNELKIPLQSKKAIVFVYPETFHGTCTISLAKLIHIRWILAPVSSSNISRWGTRDLVFHFSREYSYIPKYTIKRDNMLQVGIGQREQNNDLFGTAKRGTAYSGKRDIRTRVKSIELPEPWIYVDKSKSQDLKPFQYFLSDDPFSFECFNAVMSGTIAVVIPQSSMTKAQWYCKTPVADYLLEHGGHIPGIAFGSGKEEIRYANETRSQVHNFLLSVKLWGEKVTLGRFLRDCYRLSHGDLQFESAHFVHDAYC